MIPKFIQIITGINGSGGDNDHIIYGLDKEGQIWIWVNWKKPQNWEKLEDFTG